MAHVDGRLVRYVKGGWRGGGCDVSSHIDVAGGRSCASLAARRRRLFARVSSRAFQ